MGYAHVFILCDPLNTTSQSVARASSLMGRTCPKSTTTSCTVLPESKSVKSGLYTTRNDKERNLGSSLVYLDQLYHVHFDLYPLQHAKRF